MTALLGLVLVCLGCVWAARIGFGPACRRCGVQDGSERYHGLCLACDRAVREARMGLTARWVKP
jgi:hypothetical protein